MCCRYCGKGYMKRSSLDKHLALCELLQSARTSSYSNQDEEEIPSQRKMYMMLLELGKKVRSLDEKVEEINKWVVRKKKTINIVEWLNEHVTPETRFEDLIAHITVKEEDIDYLLQHSFQETLQQLLERTLHMRAQDKEHPLPIIAFTQKAHLLYVYDSKEDGECVWREVSRDILVRFFNRIHMKLHKHFFQWKCEHRKRAEEDETFAILCDRTTTKLMQVDFREESTYGKCKQSLYQHLKIEMLAFVEYEFDF